MGEKILEEKKRILKNLVYPRSYNFKVPENVQEKISVLGKKTARKNVLGKIPVLTVHS